MAERFVDTVQQEIAEEKAGALGRSGLRLEHALETFRLHEAARATAAEASRDRLLWDLAERIEAFVVQREACGLRDLRHVLEHYDIPREAMARIGARRPK
jgi:hypothetical protein